MPADGHESRSLVRAAESMSRIRWPYTSAAVAWMVALGVRAFRLGPEVATDTLSWLGVGCVALLGVCILCLSIASRSFMQGAPDRHELHIASGLQQLYTHRVFALVALAGVGAIAVANALGAWA